MTEPNLAENIFRELTEPLILIDELRRVVCTSSAFDRFCGPHQSDCRCDSILLPCMNDGGVESCCWDNLDIYLDQGGRALWPLITKAGEIRPALCHVSTIDLFAKPLYIVLRFTLLADTASPVALDFFGAQRRSLGSSEVYAAWLKHYLQQHYRPRSIAWLGIESDWPGHQDERKQAIQLTQARSALVGTPIPFDLLLRRGRKSFLYHVFPCVGDRGKVDALVMSAPQNGFEAHTVDEIRQAVSLTTTQTPIGAGKGTSVAATDFGFTEKEQQVLCLLATGVTDKEVAERLNLSIHTVKNHVRSMMEKAQVHKRTVLVTLASA